ncbi:uncharacterized protein SPSK_10730 [Sporothrix schenckii 1099-18]|uniref:Uncharacterized protein n=1 Tax=Sporothrix schenckii 1099-18 TaxID=1397361 RepID=A0A0F2MNQ5_SPOSC|nr:uncharacterized protein SPSK_10730 [Sporothrix schenckii 1099-18]KJR89821.1 hypothetical protein SPSK_10730 [Sporothrix schenckii 1099-18]
MDEAAKRACVDQVVDTFCVCAAMNFKFANGDGERSKDWRQRVQLRLAEEGFLEVGRAWRARHWVDFNTQCSEEE